MIKTIGCRTVGKRMLLLLRNFLMSIVGGVIASHFTSHSLLLKLAVFFVGVKYIICRLVIGSISYFWLFLLMTVALTVGQARGRWN